MSDHLFRRLQRYYHGGSPAYTVNVERQAISTRAVAILSIIYTLLYVGPLYLSQTTRPNAHLSRDAPSVIRARIRAVTISCIISAVSTTLIININIIITGNSNEHVADPSHWRALHLLGYWPLSPTDIAKTFLLTAILFAGPLFEKGVVEGGWQGWIRGRRAREVLGSWIGWRNYIAGPITEELHFRSALVPLHILSALSPTKIIFLTPLYFGIAHLHHLYEYMVTHPDTPFLPAVVRSLVQFGYTSVFGFYATFIFLRTASLPAVIIIHSFCNWAGLPRFWGRVESSLHRPMGPPPVMLAEGKGEDADKMVGRDQRRGMDVSVGTDHGVRWQHTSLLWTVTYYVLLVAGPLAFWRLLWVLTESERALVEFG